MFPMMYGYIAFNLFGDIKSFTVSLHILRNETDNVCVGALTSGSGGGFYKLTLPFFTVMRIWS